MTTAVDLEWGCRNVLAPPAPFKDRPEYAHAEKLAVDLAELLAPQSGAYYDIWLDGEKFVSSTFEVQPSMANLSIASSTCGRTCRSWLWSGEHISIPFAHQLQRSIKDSAIMHAF